MIIVDEYETGYRTPDGTGICDTLDMDVSVLSIMLPVIPLDKHNPEGVGGVLVHLRTKAYLQPKHWRSVL